MELTNWADQVLKKRLENVRGVGSVTLVGGTKREINIYLNPQAMEALGVTADQVVAAVRNENQDLPVGAHPLAAAGARGADRRPHAAPRGLRPHHRGQQGHAAASAGAPGPGGPREATARRRSEAWRCTTASAPCC
jgi:hypothetical protein